MPKLNADAYTRPLVDEAKLDPLEWEAVLEMHARFKDARYPDEAVLGWFRLDRWTYLRYLRARGGDVDKAAEMLSATLAFRREHRPHELSEHDPELRALLDQHVWHLAGATKGGHALTVSLLGNLDAAAFADRALYLKYVILCNELYCRDLDRRQWPAEQTVAVFDLKDWSVLRHGTPANVGLSKALIEVAEKHYPEMLHKCVVLNAPAAFSAMWALMTPLLAKRTREKVVFSADPAFLLGLADADALCACHGGSKQGAYASLYTE